MKTILLHVHNDDGFEARYENALDLARFYDAHLTCVQAVPYVSYAGEPLTGAVFSAELYAEAMDKMRARVEADLAKEGVSWDWIDSHGAGAIAVLAHSVLSDLIVLSRAGGPLDIEGPAPIVGDILLHARCPVFLGAEGESGFDTGAPLLLAWNGSPEASTALRLSRTMLKAASAVHILSVEKDGETHLPGRGAAEYLSRYGIHAEAHARPPEGSIAKTITAFAKEIDAGAVVMGAYGRSRLMELVLGGVTREMIMESGLPLILAH